LLRETSPGSSSRHGDRVSDEPISPSAASMDASVSVASWRAAVLIPARVSCAAPIRGGVDPPNRGGGAVRDSRLDTGSRL